MLTYQDVQTSIEEHLVEFNRLELPAVMSSNQHQQKKKKRPITLWILSLYRWSFIQSSVGPKMFSLTFEMIPQYNNFKSSSKERLLWITINQDIIIFCNKFSPQIIIFPCQPAAAACLLFTALLANRHNHVRSGVNKMIICEYAIMKRAKIIKVI